MAQIYALNADGIKFQELDLDLTDLFGFSPKDMSPHDLMDFSISNLSLKDWWPRLALEFSPRPAYPMGTVPDISFWYGASLVLSPKAYFYLSIPLMAYSEFLPCSVGAETFYIFNCMTIAT